MLEKMIVLLRKLGILRIGGAKGTFTSAKDKSDELTFERVYDANRDQLHKEDVNKVAQVATNRSNSALIAKILFALAVLAGVSFVIGLLAVSGFTFWVIILIAFWVFIIRRFWTSISIGGLSLGLMSVYLVGSIFISSIIANVAGSSEETSSKSVPAVQAGQETIIQAERATLSGVGQYTLVSETSNTTDTNGGYLYLGDGGAKAKYEINIPQAGPYVLWIRQSDDGLFADGDRSVSVTIGDESQNWINQSRDTSGWVYEKIGVFTLKKGVNEVIFTKLATTSAAFSMDEFVLSVNPDYAPPSDIRGIWQASATIDTAETPPCTWNGTFTLIITAQSKSTFESTISFDTPETSCGSIGNDAVPLEDVGLNGSTIYNLDYGSFGKFSGSFSGSTITFKQESATEYYTVQSGQISFARADRTP